MGLSLKFLRLKEEYLRYLIIVGFTVILIVLFTAINPIYLKLGNVMNLISQTAVLAILAIGMSFVMISGGIDLSVGSSIAFSGALAALALKYTGNSMIAIILALIGGSFIGLVNGFIVGKLKINAFIATLSTLILARGLTIGLLGGNAVRIFDKVLLWLGQTTIGPIPVILVVVVILYLVFFQFSKYSVFGRGIYAIGGNSITARLAGIKIEKQIILIYVINGVLVGLASIFTIGRLSSIQPYSGLGIEFEVIAAVVLGGISIVGGEGSIIGVLLGTILMGALSNGLILINLPNYYIDVIKGGILLAAVTFDKMFLQYFLIIEKKNFINKQKK